MLLPKRVKYRRVHRGRLTGKAYRGNTVSYGDFGLQALETAREAMRLAMHKLPIKCKFIVKDNEETAE